MTPLREAEQRLTERLRDIEVHATAHRELALSLDRAAARRAVCRAMRTGCGATGVGLYEPTGAELVLVLSDGLFPCSPVMTTVELSDTVGAYRDGLRRFVCDAAVSQRISQPIPRDADTSSVLFEPLLSGGRTVGVITVVWAERVERFPPRVEALLPMLLTEVAGALERANLVDQLSVAVHTDALTGLPNRQALDDLLPQELERAARSGLPLCLAVIDLDHFKAYNDTHGHPAGDVLLRGAGLQVRSVLRSTDALVRFGGEAFLVVLPECDLPDARELLEALWCATPHEQGCSISVARWDGTETVAALLHRADQTMYLARNAGRDRVLATDDPQTSRLADQPRANADLSLTAMGGGH